MVLLKTHSLPQSADTEAPGSPCKVGSYWLVDSRVASWCLKIHLSMKHGTACHKTAYLTWLMGYAWLCNIFKLDHLGRIYLTHRGIHILENSTYILNMASGVYSITILGWRSPSLPGIAVSTWPRISLSPAASRRPSCGSWGGFPTVCPKKPLGHWFGLWEESIGKSHVFCIFLPLQAWKTVSGRLSIKTIQWSWVPAAKSFRLNLQYCILGLGPPKKQTQRVLRFFSLPSEAKNNLTHFDTLQQAKHGNLKSQWVYQENHS